MAEAFIVRRGGGGSGGTLVVTSSGAGTVTISNTTLGKSYSKSVTAGGSVTFKGLKTGDWAVTLSDGVQTSTKTVTVNADYSTSIAYFAATISITYPAESTCVVTNLSGETVASDSNTDSSAKTWTATVNAADTYTITATSTSVSSKTKSTTVSIEEDGQSKSVTLSYLTYYYNKGDTFDSITGGWVKAGNGGSLTFNAESMTLIANTSQVGTDAVTTNMISLANIKTLYFSVKSATSYPTPGYPRVGIAKTTNNPSSGASNASKWTAFSGLSASSEFQTVSIDVSECTESYYIAFGGYRGDSGGATIEVEAIWGDDI